MIKCSTYLDRERRIAYMMLPTRGNFHRLESPDAVDLLGIGKRFQNFRDEDRAGVDVEAAAMGGWEEPREGTDVEGDAVASRELMASGNTWNPSVSSTGGEVRTRDKVS
ncbi:hypothetical protein CY34DRAFT_397557 [Suillus luteus UH-Slu-Lm8-n1]|uniref:Uncharacterized protein n=1 Tax=Suillus luteus UH-Slu-Lm8-n1 TaxID=930992 RepID=A0A0D0AJK8_9AGAM|nr:hypothetical protein CY34DRAFT_397557 [Suillus luteus UH-Slu-Lm8-n1]